MAVSTIKTTNTLDKGLILAPERYHPGRNLKYETGVKTVTLNDLVNISNKTFTKKDVKTNNDELYLINTGDVSEGKIVGNKELIDDIKSSKKIINPGDVIISRLRPYLRQVAYVDNILEKDNVTYLASTEFYVLKPIELNKSIAFLVPFLLSKPVQEVFANAVEGSQHPRFNLDVLMSLEIPFEIVQNSTKISNQVLSSIKDYRSYEKKIKGCIDYLNELI